MRMPFGKFRGHLLNDVPTNYLQWLLREAEYVDERLRVAVYNELRDRDIEPNDAAHGRADTRSREGNGRQDRSAAFVPLDTLRAQLKGWYREMVMLYHPDRRSGQDEGMKALITGYQRLTELLGLNR